MRPVKKFSVGDQITLYTGDKHRVSPDYIPYKRAKAPLITNLGSYCSYCEASIQLVRDIEVEHIHPRSIEAYKNEENSWDNFLLSCSTCNGKDNKSNHDVDLEHCHMPHRNNTFLSFKYAAGGVVCVNPALSGASQANAQALLSLIGLDKSPKTSKPTDNRWKNRLDTWNLSQIYLKKYKEHKLEVDVIIDMVKARGGWSIWFTVFEGMDEVRARLISDFEGTAAECFDAQNHYAPIYRNPGKDDPV